jgi:homoserine kinase
MTFYIKVPGSTSNLGPGFDSIGLALDRYLYISVKRASNWCIQFLQPPTTLPDLKDNLIYIAAMKTSKLADKELPPLEINMYSEIPLARGLGSSAAAIVAGIEIADTILELHLSKKERAHLASTLEGHPDNTTASLYGGLTISTYTKLETETLVCPAPNIELITIIPNYELETKRARQILPKDLPFSDAVKGSSISNVLVAAILQDDWELAGKMMERDVFHQPYRENLVPDLSRVTAFGRTNGVLGTALSGAGPTIISIVPNDCGNSIKRLFEKAFPEYQYQVLTPVNDGVTRIQNFFENSPPIISASF